MGIPWAINNKQLIKHIEMLTKPKIKIMKNKVFSKKNRKM